MSIVDYLDTNKVLIDVPGRSKKQVIEELAERVATLTADRPQPALFVRYGDAPGASWTHKK